MLIFVHWQVAETAIHSQHFGPSGREVSVSDNGVVQGIVTILTLLSVNMWAPHYRPASMFISAKSQLNHHACFC